MKYKISKVSEILSQLELSIENNNPFSLIRFGDGGLKMMQSYTRNNVKNINMIGEKEGIPFKKMDGVLKLWAVYANKSDYIDSPSVYDKQYFWGRYKKNYVPINKGTAILLNGWEKVYNDVGILTNNRKYCNPEFNWLSILNSEENLLSLMKGKKICFISVFKKINRLKNFNIDYIKIPDHYEDQFNNGFSNVMEFIEKNSDKYDLWLNSSGELGRLYSGRIRELGGRVLDMGFVAQYWNNFKRPERFNKFIEPDINNSLQMKLTLFGKHYSRNI